MKIHIKYLEQALKSIDRLCERMSVEEAIANVSANMCIPWLVLTKYYTEYKDPVKETHNVGECLKRFPD